jgi:hypothetical protein
MARHHGKFLVFALSALMGLFAGQAQAEVITITVTTGSSTIVTTPFELPGSSSSSVGIDVSALNPLLTAAGSAYQFSSLGATSDFPGQTGDVGGALSLNGQIFIPAGTSTGDTALSVTVTESGFTAPTGPVGTLVSSTSGTFTQANGGSSTANSMFNAIATSPVTLTATSANSSLNGTASVAVGPVSTGYTLTNNISFALPLPGAGSLAQPTDSFGVAATITAANVIPEPGSIVMMLTGLPLPLVVMGMFRRHRRQVA